jgi:hypothetical protein
METTNGERTEYFGSTEEPGGAELSMAFIESVETAIEERARTLLSRELRTHGPSIDRAAVALSARVAVLSELEALSIQSNMQEDIK